MSSEAYAYRQENCIYIANKEVLSLSLSTPTPTYIWHMDKGFKCYLFQIIVAILA